MRRLVAQIRVELLMVLRNGEQLLLTLGIPVLLLVFFSLIDVLPTGTAEPIDFLAPGVLSLAVMSTAMVSLGIGTGFERSYKVLKRLGTTPLGRGRLVAAKAASVVVVEALQFAVIAGTALALGWSPVGAVWAAGVGAVVLGTVAFAGVGLLLAGRLRGEINLAAQNALYLVLLLFGGMVVPIDELPSVLQTAARTLPAASLSDILHWALGTGSLHAASWPVLTAWALVAPTAAARFFRWE